MTEGKQPVSLGDVTKAAHAMQNVLLLLQAHTEMLKDKISSDLPQTGKVLMVKEVQAIYFNTRRLSRLLDSVLIYERADHLSQMLKKEQIDICGLILDLVQEYRAAFPKVIFTLRLPISLSLPLDKEKMTIVLRNIIENAIKYSGVAEQTKQMVMITVQGNTDRKCIVTIRDQGLGIDAQDLSKIFLPFYRGKEGINKRGSGLGLAISQEIMRLHGGKIGITSKKNKGVEVVLSMPL